MASLLAVACKAAPDESFGHPVEKCDPACDDAHICCYSFRYETLNPDGGDPSFTYADAAQEFILKPTCAIPLTRDAGESGEVIAIEDGGPGSCEVDPPL